MPSPRSPQSLLALLASAAATLLLIACGQRGPLVLPPLPQPGYVPPPIPASVKQRQEEEKKRLEAEQQRRDAERQKQ